MGDKNAKFLDLSKHLEEEGTGKSLVTK
jgi:hypothetical protein